MKRQIVLSLLICTIMSGTFVNAQKREFRATWFQTVWAGDFPKTSGATNQINEMKDKFNTLQSCNMNVICFQVRSRCDAFYNSAYEPWSSDLKVTRGTNPGYDPLATAIEEAHKRGMELHVWLNPYRYETEANQWGSNDPIRRNHSNWLLTYSSGMSILDPGNPEVVTYIANIVKDILSKYDVDGVLFDDYFYAYEGTPNSLDQTTYNRYGNGMNRSDWRRANVNKMVAAVYNTIQSTKPWVRFGVSPFGIWSTSSAAASKYGVTLPSGITGNNTYESIYCDPLAWLQEGTVDYISPQLYWKTTSTGQDYDVLCPWWSNIVQNFTNRRSDGKKFHFYSSMSRTSTTNSESTLQLQRNRSSDKMGAPGHIWFNTTSFMASSYPAELASNLFSKKALAPAMDWKNHPTLPAVTDITINGTSMTWQYKSSANANPEARFTIYRFSKSTSVSSGIADQNNLLGVSYTPSFTLPSSYNSNYTYAVCTLDRYGNEFEAAVYSPASVTTQNATNIAKTTATLNGTTTTTSVQAKGFEWKKSSAANYTTLNGTFSGNNLSANLTGLQANTSYTFRAFIKVGGSTIYGATKTFTTLSLTPPTFNAQVTNITKNSAKLNATITNGDETVTTQGFEWKIAGGQYTQVPANKLNGQISTTLNSLTPNTNYVMRAYAKTASGTFYSNEVSFTTSDIVHTTVTTIGTSNITKNSVTLEGSITQGDEAIVEKGFEWKRNATGSSYATIAGTLSGNNLTANLTGLTHSSNYIFRAFARTASNTYYGVEMGFSTITLINPTVTTKAATNVSGKTATIAGSVAVGSEIILEKGLYWKRKTDANFTKIDCSTQGTNFAHNLTGLAYNTTYQFKAYARTESGTTEGSTLEFTTQPDPIDLEGKVTITPLWLNTTDIYDGNQQRSMAYYNNRLYIPRITESGTYMILDATNGSKIAEKTVTYFSSKWNMMNVTITDDGEILFGSSLIGSSQIAVNVGNRDNDGLKTSYTFSTSGFGRSDYFSFYGNYYGTGYLFALSNTTQQAVRIPVNNGTAGEPEFISSSYIPTGKSTKTLPISATEFYTQTSDFVPRLNNTNGNMLQGFNNQLTQQNNASGMTTFELRGRKFMAVAKDTLGSIRLFDITKGLQAAEEVVPATPSLATVANDAFTLGLCSSVTDDRARIYVLVPNNCIAAYEVSIYRATTDIKPKQNAVYQVFNTTNGIRIETPQEANVEIYDLRGVLVESRQIAYSTDFTLRRGAYIVRVDNQTFKVIR